MSAARRLIVAGAVVLVLAVALLPGVSRAQDDAPLSKWIQLLWDAESVDAEAVADYHARERDLRITTIAQWHNGEQRWRLWRPSVPAVRQRFRAAGARRDLLVPRDLCRAGAAGLRHLAGGRVGAGARWGDRHRRPEQSREGYDRRLFRHWIDADGDGCDTRREVADPRCREAPVVGARCSLSGGRWVSLYDGRVFTDAGDLDIDHMVPARRGVGLGRVGLAGGAAAGLRNDLDNRFALLAVSASSNRSKGARDLAEWLPPDESSHCAYATAWRAIKVAWGLTFDQAEADALAAALATCGG